jgi:O-antigen/teichoic acid export membrane protein
LNSDRTVAKNIISLITREVLNKGALFLLIVLIGRFLGKEALGRYSLALAISQICFFGTELGLNTLAIREVAKDKLLAGRVLLNVGLVRVILGIVTLGFIWLITFIIGAGGETRIVICLCAMSYFFISMITLYTSIFRAFEKMELELLVSLLKNALFLPLAVYALFTDMGLIAIFNIFLASNILALIMTHIIYVRQLNISAAGYDMTFIRSQLVSTLPLWIAQLFGIAHLKLAPMLLFRFTGAGAVGLYNAAFVIVDGFWILAGCFASSFFPVVSRLAAASWIDSRRQYFKGLRLLGFIFIPAAVLLILGDSVIIKSVYGTGFAEISALFKILSVVACLVALNVHNSLTIIAIGRQRVMPFINGAGLAINFFLSLFLIPGLGYMGSAYALVIGETAILISMAAALITFFKTGKS